MFGQGLDARRLRAEMAARDFRWQWKYYGSLFDGVAHNRPDDLAEHNSFLHILFDFGDLLESPHLPEPLEITRLEISLLIPEWLAFMLCHNCGASWAAARTLRWICESITASTAAVLDASLFIPRRMKGAALQGDEFRRWLRHYDLPPRHKDRALFPREMALTVMGLSAKERARAAKLYHALCKFVHLSKSYFAYDPIPDITLRLRRFDYVSRLAAPTMDLVLYGLVKATLSQGLNGSFLTGFSQVFDPHAIFSLRGTNFPLTRKALRAVLGSRV